MATYEFQCLDDQCINYVEPFDVRLPMDERDTAQVLCPTCDGSARRQVVPSKAPMCVMTSPLETGGHIQERMLP